jgi:hypothetical protein
MSTIAAGTTSGTALVNTGDTTGNLVFQTNGTTTALTLSTAQNASFVGTVTATSSVAVSGTSSGPADVKIYEDTDNGTNYVSLTVPASIASNVTCTLPSTTSTLGYINLPAVGTKTGSYTLAVGDVGKYVQVGTGGSITIPDATFAEGDVVIIANNTTGNITITCTITTAYIAGTDSDKASVTLATRGLANIVFLSGTVCIISGNVS